MTWDRKSQFLLQISLGLWRLTFHRQVFVTELNVELSCPLLNLQAPIPSPGVWVTYFLSVTPKLPNNYFLISVSTAFSRGSFAEEETPYLM